MRKQNPKKESKVFNTIRRIKNIFFAVILVALVGVILLSLVTRISGKTPSIMGYTIYRVSSGSMVPTLKVGEIILSKECDPLTLENGDIITYDGTEGQFAGKSVTHRVIKEPYKKDGEYYLVTKGDDNPLEDTPIKISQVTGKLLYRIDFLKAMYDFFITPWGLLSMIALIILAFFNEIIVFVRALLGRGYEKEKKESVEDIIARYQKEQQQQNAEKAEPVEAQQQAEPEQEADNLEDETSSLEPEQEADDLEDESSSPNPDENGEMD